MRRLVAIALALAGLSTLAVVGCGSNGGSSGYRVRAVFDNAVSVIPGETVKIAGVNVGKVDSLDVTKDAKADIVLNVTEPGFQDFRKDARCTIRPEGFIGEKFVECTPTQPRQAGAPQAPKLDKIRSGRGKGQYLLPVTNTSTPVDLDLINDIFRLPYAQRLSLILNELGAGLAGRGKDLNTVIRRANPALQEVDKVLAILAQQNRTLADLAVNSDKVLAPLARDRNRVADFIVKANNTSQATAERRADLERNFQRLPTFLRELRPTLRQLSALSDSATPTLNDLRSTAPTLNRLVLRLGPFADASRPAIRSLGAASEEGSRALPAARPIVSQLRQFANTARPLAANLNQLVTSIRDTGGVERIMDFVFYLTTTTNGFDSLGRFFRVNLGANTCSLYATTPSAACTANFNGPSETATARSLSPRGVTTGGRDPRLVAAEKVYRGMSVEQALKEGNLQSVDEVYGGGKGADAGASGQGAGSSTDAQRRSGADAPIAIPALPALGSPPGEGAGATTTTPRSTAGAPTTTPTTESSARARRKARARARAASRPSAPGAQDPAARAAADQQQAQNSLFDYLLGSGR